MCNYRQLNTGVGVMCGWCLAYYTGVVLNTVRESATPDSKENKQADAGSRRFRRHFLCGALLCNFSSTEHEGLSTYVQRECSAEPFMRSLTSLRLRVVSHTKERIYYHLPEKKKGEERKTREKGERRKEKGVPDRGNTKQPFVETILRN